MNPDDALPAGEDGPLARLAPPKGCLYLGREDDPDTFFLTPHAVHRCQATDPASAIELGHQARHCFEDAASCPRYIPPLVPGARQAPRRSADGDDDGTIEPVPRSRPAPARSPVAEGPAAPAAEGSALARLGELSFETIVVAVVVLGLLAVLAYVAIARPQGVVPAALPPSVIATLTAAAPTSGPAGATMAPEAGMLTQPTRAAAARREEPGPPPEAALPPTAQPGGLMAALSPAERAVGSFPATGRLPVFGDRNLKVGHFEGETYLGGLLFSLSKIPQGSRVTYVALELAGLSDSQLVDEGEWTVELLDSPAARDWANLTFETLDEAPATALEDAWRLPAAELAPRRVNVLEFSAEALAVFAARMAEGRLAFRIRGPAAAAGTEGDAGRDGNLFIWDSGYGEGFGTRPVLRVAFVPPPATATPVRAADGQPQPTPLDLVVWVSDPSPAPPMPTPTPFPAETYARLKGMILYLSDRFKPVEGRDNSGQRAAGTSDPAQQLMVFDPATGRNGQVTQAWTYRQAQINSSQGADLRAGVEGRKCGAGTCTVITIRDKFGEAPRALTENGYTHYDPAVSPDGEWIAYVTTHLVNDEIFKIHRGGAGPGGASHFRLTTSTWESNKHPSFSPDGGQIVFHSNRDGRLQLYVMDADGGRLRKLLDSPYNDFDPVWVR